MAVRYSTIDTPAQWRDIKKYLPVLWVEDTEGIIAYDEDGQLMGAMIFDNWCGNSVQTHFLLRNPLLLRHEFLNFCFGYVFEQREKKVMYAMILGTNKKSLNICRRFGATEKCRLEEGFKDGVDYVMMELKKENCTYLRGDV